ncbi:MAG: hypothetical protein GQ551_08665 [Myxococcales bacterium]|nr:hypothetical protein [Myxococcales bacterium]
MNKYLLNAACLSLLALFAIACGDPGLVDEPIVDGEFDDEVVEDEVLEDEIVEDEVVEDLIAPFDNDSAANPAVDEFLSITNTREIVYTDQISAEDGDNEDFIQFELPNNSNPVQRITVSIDCDVYGDENVFARVELLNVNGNDATRITGPPIDCNEGEFFVSIRNDQVQLARVYVQGVPEEQTMIEYTLVVAPF